MTSDAVCCQGASDDKELKKLDVELGVGCEETKPMSLLEITNLKNRLREALVLIQSNMNLLWNGSAVFVVIALVVAICAAKTWNGSILGWFLVVEMAVFLLGALWLYGKMKNKSSAFDVIFRRLRWLEFTTLAETKKVIRKGRELPYVLSFENEHGVICRRLCWGELIFAASQSDTVCNEILSEQDDERASLFASDLQAYKACPSDFKEPALVCNG